MTALATSAIVLDFETTGLSPNQGDRAIEIGAVKLENGQVVDRFQSLMNPGFRVSGFIEGYTGITNNMLNHAPSCDEVMSEFVDFIGDANLVAHNASFDKRFLDAELDLIGKGTKVSLHAHSWFLDASTKKSVHTNWATLWRTTTLPMMVCFTAR